MPRLSSSMNESQLMPLVLVNPPPLFLDVPFATEAALHRSSMRPSAHFASCRVLFPTTKRHNALQWHHYLSPPLAAADT
jgi:hypothetical protein